MGRHFLLVFGLSAAGALAQTDPAWWSNVIRSGDSHALENNYAPANLGQLKHFADKARLHLNSELDGGSGEAIETMVAGWTGSLDGAYEVANIGQIKSVADRFYARLDQVGFDYKTQLQNNGYNGVWTSVSGGHERPWNESAAHEANYSPANIGQLKILFSFDLSGFSPTDTDRDGFADAYETQAGSNPNDYFSQPGKTVVPRIFVYGGGGGWVESGNYSSEPITYKVIDSVTGVSLVSAPVSVAVSAGTGALASAPSGTASSPLSLLSDSQGLVKVYFKAPNP